MLGLSLTEEELRFQDLKSNRLLLLKGMCQINLFGIIGFFLTIQILRLAQNMRRIKHRKYYANFVHEV